MEINSPIGNLIKVFEQVRKSAAAYETRLQKNEAATRAALIDPVLRSLGWDITNLGMVELERVFSNTRVDYALMDCQGQVRKIVEAKSLGADLNDQRYLTTLIAYLFTYGIQEIVLTDGIRWQFYVQPQPGNVTPKTFHLLEDDPVDCADYFIRAMDAAKYWLSRPEQKPDGNHQVHDKAPQPAINQVISIPVKPVQAAEKPPAKPQAPYYAQGREFIPLHLLTGDYIGSGAPKLLRLPDESVVVISTWGSLIWECVKFTLAHNSKLPIPLKDHAERNNYLIFKTPPGPQVNTFREYLYNGSTVYINLKYNANACVKNAVYILKYLPKEFQSLPAAVSFSKP